jgi:GDP-4-dehydro-6-deoxy-D-mannose reductase
VRVIPVRSFNHSGIGQAPSFLLPSLVARAMALRGSTDRNARLTIGNGGSIRDFLHVEDVVAAYIALVARGRAGEVYNVASGVGVSVKELAVQVLSATGVKAPIAPDATLVRTVDVPALIGDSTRLRDATGWEPARTVRDIIDDLVRVATRSAERASPSRPPHASAR